MEQAAYYRKYVILSEKDPGFGIQRPPEGFARLDGNREGITLSLQIKNLREGTEPYSVILVYGRNDEMGVIRAGSLEVVSKNGFFSRRLDYEAIRTINMQPDNILYVIIAAERTERIFIPMVGVCNKAYPWNESVRQRIAKKQRPQPVVSEIKQVSEVRPVTAQVRSPGWSEPVVKPTPKASQTLQPEPEMDALRSVQRPEVSPAFQSELRPEINTSLRQELKPDVNPAIKIERKPGINPTIWQEPNPGMKSTFQSESKPETSPHLRPESKTGVNPTLRPESEPDSTHNHNPNPNPNLNPSPNPNPNTNTNPDPNSDTNSKSNSNSNSNLNPNPNPNHHAAHNPEPSSDLKFDGAYLADIMNKLLNPSPEKKGVVEAQTEKAEVRPKTFEEKSDYPESKVDDIRLERKLKDSFEAFEPFANPRHDYSWYRVNDLARLSNLLFACNMRIPLFANPKILVGLFKYRHLLAGFYRSERNHMKYFVLGVPSRDDAEGQPFENISRWVEIQNLEYGDMSGYWLVYINLQSGDFVR